MFLTDFVEHFKREKELDRRRTACKNVATGVAIGTLLGITVGVLFAPKSGRETRKAIAEKTVETAEHVKQAMSEAVDELKNRMEAVEHNAREMTYSLKGSLQELRDRAKGVKEQEETDTPEIAE
jgi:gas vesicle protein